MPDAGDFGSVERRFARRSTPLAPTAWARSQRSVDAPAAWLAARTTRLWARVRQHHCLTAARRVDDIATMLRLLPGAEVVRRATRAREQLRRSGLDAAAAIDAAAVVREVCRRELGQEPFVEQIAAGFGLLRGCVVEMATGEGKTLSTVIPSALLAMSGRIVHVVTANDYLAGRDAAALRPAFAGLGLTVGAVKNGMPPDERRAAYASDITFVSNKEVAFDHLRDRLLRQRATVNEAHLRMRRAVDGPDSGALPILRGLDVAIVDEIDSVLIDDAGTPLVISAAVDAVAGDEVIAAALAIARDMIEGQHYRIGPDRMSAELSEAGRALLEERTRDQGGVWRPRIRREELGSEAVTALKALQRDRHYLVTDGRIVMVDANTGRRMPDRYWGQDLHRMIEMKEGLASSGARRNLASISFQRFFRSYRHVCGMSGTVKEVAGELARVYGMPLVRIPRRLPSRTRFGHRSTHVGRDALWRDVSGRVAELNAAGTPVLIGVRTVEEAARGSAALAASGIEHEVLSAANDAVEAEVVAKAGQAGAVTIATNMAGRGTDIRLGPGVVERGGLAVILCERHDSRRVDRQLMGRCGRQGDPGLVLEFLALDDARADGDGNAWRRLFGRVPAVLPTWLWLRQARNERLMARRRIALVRHDEQLSRVLAFAGGLD